MKVLGGKETTAQKLHLGCRHKEENDPAVTKTFILEEIPWVSTGINVCVALDMPAVLDLFSIC